jgi:5-methylcytosine-specific restriction endonuclease McrA
MSISKYRLKHFGILSSVCFICKKTNGKGDKQLTIHHKIAFADGGKDEINNIEIICLGCHKKFHNSHEPAQKLKKSLKFWESL